MSGFDLFSVICLIVAIIIVPIYMWLLRNIKNSWISNSHETYGGSMTITGTEEQPKVTWMDPIIKKIRK